jgi:hypothetical protein
MREEWERLQEAGRGSVEPTACHPYAGDGERRPRSKRGRALAQGARGRAGPETGRWPSQVRKTFFFYK